MRALVAGLLAIASGAALAQSIGGTLAISPFLSSSSIDNPTGLRFTGPNEGFVIEQGGTVKRFSNGSVASVLTLPVANGAERGLLGIAIDANFAQNGAVYLYHSAGTASGSWIDNRLSRYTWNGSNLVNGTTLATFGAANDGQASGPNHNGGPLVIGPANSGVNQGKLFGVTGDLNRTGIEQNQSSTSSALTGGVYRLDTNGSIPSDNPFASSSVAGVRPWYTYGVRNSFGISFDPATGRLWNTENGPIGYDEINLLSAGMNSGWTPIMGPDARNAATAPGDLTMLPGASYVDPKFSFANSIGITALHFLYGSSWGPEYDDAVLVGENNAGRLWLFRLNGARDGFILEGALADGVLDPGDAFAAFGSGFNVVTDIQRGTDGAVYVVALGSDTVYRVTAIPEPSTALMFLAGMTAIGTAVRRRRAKMICIA